MALFLKVFGQEVLLAFEDACVVKPRVTTRSIPYGKSAQFPALGRAAAFYHTAGKNILDAGNSLLSTIPANERIIYLDNKLISAVTINEMDELFNHYDVRGPYAAQLGIALANRYDQLGLNALVLAARTSAILTGTNGHFAGTVITDAAMATSGQAVVDAAFAAAQKLREKEVPGGADWTLVLSPAMYYNVIKNPMVTTIATAAGSAVASHGFPQFGGSDGPNGSYARGIIHQLAGFTLVMSNHIPSTNITSGDAFFGTGAASANGNVYYGDFSKTKAVAFARPALGVLTLKDISLESEWHMEYQATAMLAKLATGMGTLRPEFAIEFAIP